MLWCLQCPWHNGLRVQELEIGVPFAQAAAAIDAVLGYLKASTDEYLCFPLQGSKWSVESLIRVHPTPSPELYPPPKSTRLVPLVTKGGRQ